MSLESFLADLKQQPLIVSVQASPGSPVASPESLLLLAKASVQEGARWLRLEGTKSIQLISAELSVPVIGLIKKEYEGSGVYITPSRAEVADLLQTDCPIIALDGTTRRRPNGESLADLIAQIHDGGRLALADCDSIESVRYAMECGADVVSTTLSGYTEGSPPQSGPDFELIRAAVAMGAPVLGEGRFSTPDQVRQAIRIGASGVVVGGAINDPIKTTRAFSEAVKIYRGRIAAFDIGGTWLRFGEFDESGYLSHSDRVPTPKTRKERLAWMRQRSEGFDRVGVSCGGTIDPQTRTVWESKPFIHENEGTDFSELGTDVYALNDGLATAWAHGCLSEFVGKRIAVLALGTGVGLGCVDRDRIVVGPRGEYPRMNDVPIAEGKTFEDLVGGMNLNPPLSSENVSELNRWASFCVSQVRTLFLPDEVVVCGGVGLSSSLKVDAILSPLGEEAGLHGAHAIARFPHGLERA